MGYFLHFYPPNSPKNQNLKKMKKSNWRYHHFTYVYQTLWSDSWDMVWDWRTGRWTDGRTEEVTYRGGCPTKKTFYKQYSIFKFHNRPWCMSYNQYIHNKIKNKLCMKAINYACFKLEEKSLKVLKRTKAILSML